MNRGGGWGWVPSDVVDVLHVRAVEQHPATDASSFKLLGRFRLLPWLASARHPAIMRAARYRDERAFRLRLLAASANNQGSLSGSGLLEIHETVQSELHRQGRGKDV